MTSVFSCLQSVCIHPFLSLSLDLVAQKFAYEIWLSGGGVLCVIFVAWYHWTVQTFINALIIMVPWTNDRKKSLKVESYSLTLDKHWEIVDQQDITQAERALKPQKRVQQESTSAYQLLMDLQHLGVRLTRLLEKNIKHWSKVELRIFELWWNYSGNN